MTDDDVSRRLSVIRAILEERAFQDRKWGPLGKQNDSNPRFWLAALMEQVAQTRDCMPLSYRGSRPKKKLYLEVVQVAAVALAWLEQLAPADLEARVKKYRAGKK